MRVYVPYCHFIAAGGICVCWVYASCWRYWGDCSMSTRQLTDSLLVLSSTFAIWGLMFLAINELGHVERKSRKKLTIIYSDLECARECRPSISKKREHSQSSCVVKTLGPEDNAYTQNQLQPLLEYPQEAHTVVSSSDKITNYLSSMVAPSGGNNNHYVSIPSNNNHGPVHGEHVTAYSDDVSGNVFTLITAMSISVQLAVGVVNLKNILQYYIFLNWRMSLWDQIVLVFVPCLCCFVEFSLVVGSGILLYTSDCDVIYMRENPDDPVISKNMAPTKRIQQM